MINLEGKRLLVLGGSLWKDSIKAFADKHKVKIIATGNDTSAGIFEIADEHYSVNSTDQTKMKELIKSQNIDGVYMGGSEVVIHSACQYITELGLPCYCNIEQWEFLQDKSKFKNLCIKHNLPVVPKFDIHIDQFDFPENAFPVIIKPTDGFGSNGFSLCHNNVELEQGYKNAIKYSASGKAIVEKFVNNKANVVFYTVTNGKIIFSSLSEKYPVKFLTKNSYVSGLFVYQSKYVKEFRNKFEAKIQNLVDDLKIKEGNFWIEVFHSDDKYYFNEVGFRYGGSASIYPIDYYFGINQVASDLYFALTGESMIRNHSALLDIKVKKKHYAVLPIYVKAGTISRIEGMDELKNLEGVIKIIQVKKTGDLIHDTASFSQNYALIHLHFDDCSELKRIYNLVFKTLKVYDGNENMVLNLLDIKTLSETF